jgi:RNA polymerase sigma-70 factor (ECF subfamily)
MAVAARIQPLIPTPAGDSAPGRDVDVPALVSRAQEGDVAAFERLMAMYQPKVFGFALAFAASRDEARDLAQEALIKVYRSIGSFRFQSSLSTWLYSIVRNVFLDHHKSRASRDRALETSIDDEAHHLAEAAHAEDRLLRQDERKALWSALRRVPAAYRQVVVLFDVQGLSYDEIAQALACPVGTVKSRLKRGRDALREELFRARRGEQREEARRATSVSVVPPVPEEGEA